VVLDSDNSVVGCHKTKAKAQKQLAALNINVHSQEEPMTQENGRPPRDDLYRAMPIGVEVREMEDSKPRMVGHFAVFNEWTEINSVWEGRFLERIEPGAFRKTIEENRGSMRVLFQHGHDPELGDKVLGPIEELREDDVGGYYEVSLFDSIPPLIRDGISAGQYGASFRFAVMREEFNKKPKESLYNPERLPERSLKELTLREFGPVTFPAYAGATAGMRSVTDEFKVARLVEDPERMAQVIEFLKRNDAPGKLDAAETPHLEKPRRARRVSVDAYLARRNDG
jgi:HK97 family phage prohead protease